MAEYIEREAAIDAVLDVYYDIPDIDLSGEKFKAAILNIQAADIAPVRHGRWIKVGYACGEGEYQCSECKETEWRTSASRLKYCPSCGAKMRKEND